MGTFKDFVATVLSPVWGKGYFGSRLLGITLGLLHDTMAEALVEAVRAPWLSRADQSEDALELVGAERSMPRYPVETSTAYQTRLSEAWTTWQRAGSKATIERQLELAGFTGSVAYSPKRIHPVWGTAYGEWLRPPFTHPVTGSAWWSRFWIFVPETAWTPAPVPVCGTPGLLCGGGALCGTGASLSVVTTLRSIAKRWRAAHIVCLRIILEENAPTCGTGVLCGSGALCGGITQGIDL